MLILSKYVDSIEEAKQELQDSCRFVGSYMLSVHNNNHIETYNDYVEWAIDTCKENLPTPFSMEYPSCYGLNLGPNYFTLRIPNKFGIGIRVNKRKKISYDLDIIFYNDEDFIKTNPDVKYMTEVREWKIKTPGTKAR